MKRRALVVAGALGIGGLLSFLGDDLVKLFAPAPAGQAQPMTYRQGRILALNRVTLRNTVDVGGSIFTDLPLLGLAEAATLEPGAVVGIVGTGSTWAIVGRWVAPNTPEVANAISALSFFIRSAEVSNVDAITSTTFGDLAHVGPTVTCQIGPSGRALALLTAYLNVNEAGADAFMGLAVSGATTIAADTGHSLRIGKSGTLVAANMIITGRWTAIVYFAPEIGYGLTPGENKFTAKYAIGATGGGAAAQAADRNLTIVPL